jgi:hypothetical protein
MYKQKATIEIIIPRGNKWNVNDLLKALKKQGIKAKITAIMLGLTIPKGLIKPK